MSQAVYFNPDTLPQNMAMTARSGRTTNQALDEAASGRMIPRKNQYQVHLEVDDEKENSTFSPTSLPSSDTPNSLGSPDNTASFASPDTATFGDDLFWDGTQSWTLPEPDNICTSNVNNKIIRLGGQQYAASDPSHTFQPQIDWDSILSDESAPEHYTFGSDLDDSTDMEYWAWMDLHSPSVPVALQAPDKSECIPEGCESDDDYMQEVAVDLSTLKGKQPPKAKNRACHNAIERKYRSSINSKIAEIDQWLSGHQSASDLQCKSELKRTTKGIVLTTALGRLRHLNRCRSVLESQAKTHRIQISNLKYLVIAQRRQLGLVNDISLPKARLE